MKRPKEVNRKKKLKCLKNYRKTKTNPRLKRLKEYSIPRETEGFVNTKAYVGQVILLQV